MKPLLIGLTGRAGCGKTTVARYLEHEHAFHAAAFADPILEMVCALFAHAGIDGAWATERALKERPTTLGVSYRHLAQTLGTEWGRQLLGKDWWLRVAEAALRVPRERGDDVVIGDVRFPNEAAWIRAQGGVVVRVLRDDLPAVRAHASETEMAAIVPDTELLNYGSTSTLFDQVDRMLETLRRDA